MGIPAILSTRARVRAPALRTASRRWIGAFGALGLAAFGVAYWLTYEPAPRVRVLWREGLPAAQRAALERKYLLLNGRDPMSGGSLAYDLLDTSVPNLRALVAEPAIADTNDIDRNTLAVPFDVDYGGEWMWIAHRTPGLRDATARAGLIVLLLSVAVFGLAPDAARAWHAARRTAGAHRKQGKPFGPNLPVG